MPEDYEEFRRATVFHPDGGHGGEPMTDLDGLAALVDAVDLVICPVNSTIHFAGALGRPGWNLLPLHPDWRWVSAAGGHRGIRACRSIARRGRPTGGRSCAGWPTISANGRSAEIADEALGDEIGRAACRERVGPSV